MAIGIGILVGVPARKAGDGVDPVFGYIGVILSLGGCVFGNVLLGSAYIAAVEDVSVLFVVL